MTQTPPSQDTLSQDRAAYLKAQKMRNYAIGAGLLAFVVLVFFVTQVRMAENMRVEKAAAATTSASASQ